ncbi:YdcF family protein [Thermanaeromonas sp.]|uniref:YdcF family protein n=1 Tax=Thermanaeromonas sp. TaxID=2003697 RepID=UPI002626537A|nr:YdcF family protein [Thermanaeromonas sp.]
MLGLLTLALTISVATSRPLWLPWVARWLATGDKVLEQTDVIIVLSGEQGERVETAVKLYKQGFAPRLLMTGGPVEWNVPAAEIMAWQAESLGVPPQDIVLERRASSTYENAVYTLEILKEKGWRSAIVVTSPYHLRRTRFIFEKVFAGSNIRLSFYGAEDAWLVPEEWWHDDKGIEVVGIEYLKLLWYFVRYGFSPGN